MGVEPTTYSLGSCHSTTELRPLRAAGCPAARWDCGVLGAVGERFSMAALAVADAMSAMGVGPSGAR